MSETATFGSVDVNIVASTERTMSTPDRDTPFRLLVLGDFSGRAKNPSASVIAKMLPKPLTVDRDNFDAVMSKLNVSVRLPLGDARQTSIDIEFRQLEDFHPDRIFETLEVFELLRRTRQRLTDAKTFPDAAVEVRGWSDVSFVDDDAKEALDSYSKLPTNALAPDAPAAGGLLDYMIEESEERPRPESPAGIAPEWNEMLRDLVKPHLVSIDLDKQEELVASVDNCIGGLMRMILHHPGFQALESAWRALHFLVSRLETDSELKVFLLDVSKDELAADLTTEDLRATNCYQLFVEQSAETLGGEPWALFAGNYDFNMTHDDAVLLGRVAKVSRAARAPFIAGASPQILGCDSLAQTPDSREWHRPIDANSETWDTLRKLPEAEYLGLVLPRFLLRLPYGENTEATEQFSFEETTKAFTHENYLWGNPTFACAYLLASSFSESGWDLRPGQLLDVEDLPLHVYEEGDESQLKPCAETVLTERAAEAILDCGLMPLLSFKNEDRARLAGFQSLADPPASLAGRWQS